MIIPARNYRKLKSLRGAARRRLLILTVLALGLVLSQAVTPVVLADRFDEQIAELRAENNQNQQQVAELEDKAEDLSTKIKRLEQEIVTIQKSISANQAKRKQLNKEIIAAKKELKKKQALLGQNIRAMYLAGDISMVEMLASSQDLTTYLDKQEYRLSIKNNVSTTLDKINALKERLTNKKKQVDTLLKEQTILKQRVSGQRAEQARLLGLNKSQQRSYNAQVEKNQSQIAQLRREQAAQNARLFGSGTLNVPDSSGYPWPGVSFPNTIVDPWGMYKRQCVSYTAWKVWKSGRHMPYWGGHGNANQWDDNARAAGIPVDSNPRVGDVAVSNSGYYGHVMYVEHVYGDGTILISQYNAGWDGRYSEARISTSGLWFIHF